MTDEANWDKIELAFIVVAFCMVVIAVVYFLGYPVPGYILLIFGVAGIVVGVLKVLSVFFPDRFN